MWLVVMAVEFVHGTLRWILLRPRVGDFRSSHRGFHWQRVVALDCVCLRAMDGAAKLRRLLARGTAVGRPDARLRVEFRALRGGAFVGEHCGGVQLIARGTDAGWAGHSCDDAVDCVAITPGICESLKEDWLGGRVAPDVSSIGWEGQ